jgi:hypothetical protein
MLAYVFVLMAVAFRLFPHTAWAFTPVAASLLYFGARGPRRQWFVPLALFMGLDVYLTAIRYDYPLSADHFVTWAWYAAVLWLGTRLAENARPLRLVGAALAASVSFFVFSNLAVWMTWDMYPKTFAGLGMCYEAAVPFFRYQPAADLLFTLGFFGVAALATAPALRQKA